jgi:IclR family transcriptional regulator, pca regulon regulatory protein
MKPHRKRKPAATRNEEAGGDKDMVLGLQKGLAIIEAFSEARPRMTSSEAALITGVTRAAARRSLQTLAKLGYARFDGKYFQLEPKILRLGYQYLSALKLPELIRPTLDRISETSQESSSAAVLDRGEVLYIARSSKRRLMTIDVGVGTRLPAYCTSLGRVLLAFGGVDLDAYLAATELQRQTPFTIVKKGELRRVVADVRSQGFSLVDQELELGLRAISVPCFDRAKRCICAINVSVPAARLTAAEMVREILPTLVRARDEATYL